MLHDPEDVRFERGNGEAVVGFYTVRFPDEGGTLTFEATVQNVGDGALDTTVEFRLLPVEIDGMDRFIKGSISESAIEALGGEDEIGIRFEHLAYGQTFNYSKLSDAHIYDDPEEILNQGEIDMGANGGGGTQIEQDVVFWREGGNLHFATTFDRSGQMCMVITTKDGQELVIDHEMHCQEDVGGVSGSCNIS